MRLGKTRGMVNRSFTEHKGQAEFYNRKTGKKEKKSFSIFAEADHLEDAINTSQGSDYILLRVLKVSSETRTYSLSPEDFRKYATVYTKENNS